MRKGRTLYHCHGKDKGKKLATYSSVGKAKAAHRAIMMNKSLKGSPTFTGEEVKAGYRKVE